MEHEDSDITQLKVLLDSVDTLLCRINEEMCLIKEKEILIEMEKN